MHIHHDVAHRWFALASPRSWATCPITENGFVRIASHPSYPNRPGDVPAVLALLRRFCSSNDHHFWSDEISIRDILLPGAIINHTHITDVFLLGLAFHHGGKLATLDRKIPSTVVRGGRSTLELLDE